MNLEQALPKEWANILLGDIANFSQGIQIGTEEHISELKNGYQRFIRIIDYTQPSNTDIRYVPLQSERYYAKIDDIVMIRYGTPGIIGRGIEGIIANNMFKITFDKIVLNDFAEQYFKFPETLKKITDGSASSTMPAINFGFLKKLPFILPPLSEQQKIAEILSTVDNKIEVIYQQITETKELKKGLMQRLLTKGIGHTEFKDSPLGRIPKSWEVVKQSDVATFYNGRAYKLSEWEKEGIPVIRLQNLTGTGKNYYYSNLNLPEHQYCHKGDLLYMWSATFGPVWWFGEKAIFHYHIWKIEHNAQLLDKIFHYYLLDNVTTRMKNESHGSTMLHVTKGGMEKLLIQLPPLKEQQMIADILGSVDEKLEVLSKKKTRYKELKLGLMQQLLTGKIRVKV
ncbi:EcoKI restriction-modification system protein HsdS [compost metagenome]